MKLIRITKTEKFFRHIMDSLHLKLKKYFKAKYSTNYIQCISNYETTNCNTLLVCERNSNTHAYISLEFITLNEPTPFKISLASFERDFGYETLLSVIEEKSSSSSSPSNGG